MLACLPRAKGKSVPLRSVYARYQRWCSEQAPAASPLDASEFGRQFREISERYKLRSERRGDQIICLDVGLVA